MSHNGILPQTGNKNKYIQPVQGTDLTLNEIIGIRDNTRIRDNTHTQTGFGQFSQIRMCCHFYDI